MRSSRSFESLGWAEVALVESECDVFEETWVFVEDGVGFEGVDDGDAPMILACGSKFQVSVSGLG